MKNILTVVAIFIVAYALSWAVICGLIKLITLCFGLKFNLLIATGIWLIFCLLKAVFGKD